MSPTDLPVRAPTIDPGYVPAAAGSLLGGGAGAALGVLLGMAYAERFMPNAELEAIVPVAIGELVGVWLGAVLGAWALLNLRHKVAARSTGYLLAGALPAWGIVSLPSFFWLIQQLSGDDISNVLQVVVPVVILCVPPALVARALVVHRERLREREERSG
jgi:hypothetical protein